MSWPETGFTDTVNATEPAPSLTDASAMLITGGFVDALSLMFTVPTIWLPAWAFCGFVRVTLNCSVASSKLSVRMVIGIEVELSPAAMLTEPLVAV